MRLGGALLLAAPLGLLWACHPSILRQVPPGAASEAALRPVQSLAPAMGHVLAGDLARARGDEVEALAQYRIALLHDPGSVEIEARIARTEGE